MIARVFCSFVLVAVLSYAAHAQSPDPSAGAANVENLLTSLVLSHIPDKYENNKQWGQTTEVMRGLRFERDGLRLETRRKMQAVNHGTWKWYEISFVDPRDTFRLNIIDQKESPDGLHVTVQCDAKLHVFGRIARWERGVQLFSLCADADATVRLKIQSRLALQLDASKLPPDVLLRPVVHEAKLEVIDYRLRRISDLHGPVVRELGDSLRGVLDDKVAEQDDKLVRKLNQQIDKNKDKLRLSVQDLVKTRWGDLSGAVGNK